MKKTSILLLGLLMPLVVFSQTRHGGVELDQFAGVSQSYTSGAAVAIGHIVKLNTSGQIIEVTIADTAGVVGVAMGTAAAAGQNVRIGILGQFSAVTDGACAKGQFAAISPATDGLVRCSSSPSSSAETIGVSLSTIASPGNITVLIKGGGASASGGGTNLLPTDNTWTGVNRYNANVTVCGPNPSHNLMCFGGYASTVNPPSTTGTCTATSTTAAIAAAGDWQNGQGIVLWKCGANPAVTTPGTPTVTPIGVTGGAVNYTYKVVAHEINGALSAASPLGTTTTGAATVGTNTISLTQAARVSGVTTYTCAADCNIESGRDVNISGFSGGTNLFNGTMVVTGIPTATTFTVSQANFPDVTDTSGTPVVKIQACNKLTYASSSYSGANTLSYIIYRSDSGGPYAIKGVAIGRDPHFIDCNQGASNLPGYVPSTPPTSTQAGYLATTIVSGGGTTTLVLANAAGTSQTSTTVLHDNSKPLLAASQAALNVNGGQVYIPTDPAAANIVYVFNATTDFRTLTGTRSLRILLNSAPYIHQPWIARSNMSIEGQGKDNTSFSYSPITNVAGNAYPLLYAVRTQTGIHLKNLNLTASNPGQVGFYSDMDSTGQGVTGVLLDDVAFGISPTGQAGLVHKGGFDLWANRGICSTGGSAFPQPPCFLFTNSSVAVTGAGTAQVLGRIKLDKTAFAGGAVQVDNLPNTNSSSPTSFIFNANLYESAARPFLRLNFGANKFTSGYVFNGVDNADMTGGIGTPLVDITGSTNVANVTFFEGSATNIGSPLLVGGSNTTGLFSIHPPSVYIGSTSPWLALRNPPSSPTVLEAHGMPHSLRNGARIFYQINGPALTSAAVSAGGSVPVQQWWYAASVIDQDSQESMVGPASTVTTTGGNQAVDLAWTCVAGAKQYVVYRSSGNPATGANWRRPNTGGNPTVACSFNDTFATDVGPNAPNYGYAGDSFISSSGVASKLLSGRRIKSIGTALTPSSFTLSAGWGSTAAIASVGGTDQWFYGTVTSGGSSIAVNPTLQITFVDGTWTTTPVCYAYHTGGTGNIADWLVTARSATSYTFQWQSTPASAATYEVTVRCGGI